MDSIGPLSCPFLSAGQINNLIENDIKTVLDFLKAPADVICSLLQISESEYSVLKKSALRYSQPEPLSLLAIARSVKVIPRSTGLSGLDKMLGGGLFPGDIIELYGKTGSGKTQLCLYLTSRFCHASDDDSGVFYFDLKNDFNVLRLHVFCNSNDDSLTRVEVFKEFNLESLMEQLDDIRNQLTGDMNSFYSKVRFLVVDSVPMAIYPAVEQEPYSWRFHQERLVEKLGWLANHLNLTVILVNHAVTTRPSTSRSSISSDLTQPTVKPAMGKYWSQKISTRIHLVKCNNKRNHFVATLDKSGRSSEGQKFEFFLTDDELREVV